MSFWIQPLFILLHTGVRRSYITCTFTVFQENIFLRNTRTIQSSGQCSIIAVKFHYINHFSLLIISGGINYHFLSIFLFLILHFCFVVSHAKSLLFQLELTFLLFSWRTFRPYTIPQIEKDLKTGKSS